MYKNKKFILGLLYFSLMVMAPIKSYSKKIVEIESIHFFTNGMPEELKKLPQTFVRKEEDKLHKNFGFSNEDIGKEWENLKINHESNLQEEIGVKININKNKVKIFKDKDELVKMFIKLEVVENNKTSTEYIVCPIVEQHTSSELWMVRDPKTHLPIKFYKDKKLSPDKVLEPGYYFSRDLVKKPIISAENKNKITQEDVYAAELDLICAHVALAININELNKRSEKRRLKWMGLEHLDNK